MIRHVFDFLDACAVKFPQKMLFKEMGGGEVGYAAFKRLSEGVASEILRRLSPSPIQQPVLIILPKSIATLVSFFGVARSGNFYTLLDEKMPLERVRKICEVLKPSLLITARDLDLRLDLPTLFVEDFEGFERDAEALARVQEAHIDTNLLYVFFTSGSTGVPKGVSITHKSVIDYAFWVAEEFGFGPDCVLANQAPLYFDNSILDIFPTMKVGGSVHLVPNALFAFPLKVLEYLENEGVNTIFWVPSVLIYFANTEALAKFKLERLQKVLFCGEIMPNKQLNYWRTHLPHALFANLYGPTEITDVCCFYRVDRAFKDEEILPIGRACKNTQLLVFDADGNFISPREAGKKGELFVRGTSLSLGYYNDAQKTRQAFVQNPLHQAFYDPLYKTGDIVAYNERGELLCYGRVDFQIKFKGHRVELGEIEAVLNSHPQIKNTACIFRDEKLIAFYESEEELNLKAFLKDKLPSYMLPTSLVRVEGFALNANGKIDRKALSEKV
ncbi:amino acid adenylation domain-containing protein [Campylobacter sp.]|uniref:amino acid adenylation domain-containing protein n=1 Tax=Campylobacter sp. TaxID=205 RepID=UPI0026DB525E|nr:amino acid adenylation domain-containing protein [Campylobacter sp.]MDO4674870.1 amino acid adenylation domain-containing protein [Campylobacter sp.]